MNILAHVEAVRALLADVTYPGYRFRVDTLGDGAFLQVVYEEPDVDTGEPAEQHGRKWYISPHACQSEIVRTAFKAVLTSAEHRVREHFAYQGRRVFGPHLALEQLVALCDAGGAERRPAPPEERCARADKTALIKQWKATGQLSSELILLALRHSLDVEYYASFGQPNGRMSGPDRATQRVQIGWRVRGELHADDLFQIHRDAAEIDEAIRTFEVCVWRNWLQERYRQSRTRGHQAAADGINLLVWGCAGRVLMTLRGEGEVQVTIIAAQEGDQRIGLQSLDATKVQAVALIKLAATNTAALSGSFAPDDEVTVP